MTEQPLMAPGTVVWVSLDPTSGREQGGHRPAVVVSGQDYLDLVTTLMWVVPVTTVDRGWPNHVPLSGATGLDAPSFAMTEQIRTISRRRMSRRPGAVDPDCLQLIRSWLRDFLDL